MLLLEDYINVQKKEPVVFPRRFGTSLKILLCTLIVILWTGHSWEPKGQTGNHVNKPDSFSHAVSSAAGTETCAEIRKQVL